MHILHLIKTSKGAGWTYQMIRDISERYSNITFSVVVPPGGRHFNKYKEVCLNVYEFGFGLNASLFARGIQLRKIVKIEKPDIIHSWFAQTTLFARLFLRDIPIPRLFEVVGPFHLESFIYKYFDIFSAQKNDYWKATSEYTFNKYLKAGIAKQKLFCNYIDANLYDNQTNYAKSSICNIRDTYNIPPESKIIGTCSNMYPPKLFRKNGVKNHELLLQVFEKILVKRNDIYLIIGGKVFGSDKKYDKKLKKIAEGISREKIIFTGRAENLGRLIENFDVFVFLSLSENLGGVYESLLFQVPTVASNRGGIPELIVNGETGFTCNLKSVDEIIDKIEILLNDESLAESFKMAGKKKVFEVFDKEKSLRRSYDIYNEIIERELLK